MLVSIIIPVYNVAPYLEEALESAIKQTYKELEIIIIDDGSTDNSGAICDSYSKKDKRIRVIHQENKGLSSARNVGLNNMTGDVVAFLDSDDAYHPDFIAKLLSIMVREQADIVMCKYSDYNTEHIMNQRGNEMIVSHENQRVYDRDNALRAIVDGFISSVVWNKLYRRELWKDIRFPEGHIFEDIDTTYKIINNSKSLYALDCTLYIHRKRQGSITESRSWNKVCDRLLAYSHFYDFIELNTPALFTQAQLLHVKESQINCFNAMISIYLHHFLESIDKDGVSCEEMRKQIIQVKQRIRFGSVRFSIKIVYSMICFCPSALGTIYFIFSYIRLFAKKKIFCL